MVGKTDKRRRAESFRLRLAQAMTDAHLSQAALARAIDVDRSTVSQLLGGTGARLPNAQIVAEAARTCGVSADWLLGLTERPERATDLLAASLTLTQAPRALIDEQIFGWHVEAKGFKIRHVPAGLPDMLKTQDVLMWEYAPHLGRTVRQAIGASEDRLTWMRSSGSDYEICLPMYEIDSFARAEGYYAGLPVDTRLAQVDQLITLTEQLYPRMRLSFFDARRLYSAPITVFGPLLAVLYLGRNYLAFRDTERVTAFTEHFDQLVREASVSPEMCPFGWPSCAARSPRLWGHVPAV
ncbi:helix-turn-helix domain-containing protein [Roseobacteraceae bacterium S113]